MVYVMESMDIVHGKRQEAVEYFRKFAEWHKKNDGADFHILRSVNNAPGSKLIFVGTFDSLAAWGDSYHKARADKELGAIVREAFAEKQCIVPGSFSREFFEIE